MALKSVWEISTCSNFDLIYYQSFLFSAVWPPFELTWIFLQALAVSFFLLDKSLRLLFMAYLRYSIFYSFFIVLCLPCWAWTLLLFWTIAIIWYICNLKTRGWKLYLPAYSWWRMWLKYGIRRKKKDKIVIVLMK